MFRILAVDDEENNLQAIKRIFLDLDDYEIVFSNNGQDAIDLANSFIPDIILLDIMMPGISGYDVCQKIKENNETANCMVLFLTGKTQLSDKIKGYKSLADDYITKPYDPDELLAKVEILLRLKKVQDELRETNLNLEKIIEQKIRQLVVQERQALVGRMVHGIIHNFRNPLSSAKGFTGLIENKLKLLLSNSNKWLPEDQRSIKEVDDYIKIITISLSKIEEMLNSLLQKGRKEAIEKYQDLNLNELIAAEINFLKTDHKFKYKVIKEFDFDLCLPIFKGNYVDFSQLVSNMVVNAVDAMRNVKKKKIIVTTKYNNGKIFMVFHDNGEGISPENIDQIFEPFFSTKAIESDENKEEVTGTGIGLYSCQQLMKTYGGNITVNSKLHVGTTFTITIPTESLSLCS